MQGNINHQRFVPHPIQHSTHLFEKEEQDKAVKHFEKIVSNPGMKHESVRNLDDGLFNFAESTNHLC